MTTIELFAGKHQATFDDGITAVRQAQVTKRLWEMDHTLYSDIPDDILNRLGWLTSPKDMLPRLDDLDRLAQTLRSEGVRHVVVLGMGGAGLVTHVLEKVFGSAPGYPQLTLLDSTDSAAVRTLRDMLVLSKTVFIYSMKKWALETYSLFKYFYNEIAAVTEQPGRHFVAITDPGAWVGPFAEKMQFRRVFLNDPNIGGRYAALSYVGLLPAALSGVDTAILLERAETMQAKCRNESDNPAALLGAVIGEMAANGYDKLTFFAPLPLDGWLEWVEQLLAESTGKSGTGILPIIREPSPTVYTNDRVFVHLRLPDDNSHDEAVQRLINDGRPVIRINLQDPYDLGGQFYLWCFATAVAAERLDVQPFDQPNVEATKAATNRVLEVYTDTGELPQQSPVFAADDIQLFGDTTGATLAEALINLLNHTEPGAYIALHAYLPPSVATDNELHHLRLAMHRATGLPTTLSYGPRFLHSTGQLHKGDGGRGLFIQITTQHTETISVPHIAGQPESNYTFDVLEAAQYIGDMQALQSCNPPRRVIRAHLLDASGLQLLIQALKGIESS
jgi:transaldolase/glucose-6-phosphate isomerase